jgi:hypothetical protein
MISISVFVPWKDLSLSIYSNSVPFQLSKICYRKEETLPGLNDVVVHTIGFIAFGPQCNCASFVCLV